MRKVATRDTLGRLQEGDYAPMGYQAMTCLLTAGNRQATCTPYQVYRVLNEWLLLGMITPQEHETATVEEINGES